MITLTEWEKLQQEYPPILGSKDDMSTSMEQYYNSLPNFSKNKIQRNIEEQYGIKYIEEQFLNTNDIQLKVLLRNLMYNIHCVSLYLDHNE